MWLQTVHGDYAATLHPLQHDRVIIRSNSRHQLRELRSWLAANPDTRDETVPYPTKAVKPYGWRISISRRAWGRYCVTQAVMDLDIQDLPELVEAGDPVRADYLRQARDSLALTGVDDTAAVGS